jgi:hypothetical protein
MNETMVDGLKTFLEDNLDNFEEYLQQKGKADATRQHRMLGARQFVEFMITGEVK